MEMAWHRDPPGFMPPATMTLSNPVNSLSKRLKISDLLSPAEASVPAFTLPPHAQHVVYPPVQTQGFVHNIPAASIRTVRQSSGPDWDTFISRYAEEHKSPGGQSARPSSARSLASPVSQAVQSRSPSESPRRPITPVFPQPSAAVIPPLPEYEYKLYIRQQPVAARACGHGDRDRRVIDPPPILELKITSKQDGTPRLDQAGIFAVHCSLVDADTGRHSGSNIQGDLDTRMMSALMGASCASPFKGKDEHNIAGAFFVFSDLSCRLTGRFRLDFELLRIDATNRQQGARVATVSSNVFTSYNAKDFPGMQASTPLLKALRQQGLTVSIKKGSEQRKFRSRMGAGTPTYSDTDIARGKRKASTDSVLYASSIDTTDHKRFRHNADRME